MDCPWVARGLVVLAHGSAMGCTLLLATSMRCLWVLCTSPWVDHGSPMAVKILSHGPPMNFDMSSRGSPMGYHADGLLMGRPW